MLIWWVESPENKSNLIYGLDDLSYCAPHAVTKATDTLYFGSIVAQ